MIPDSMVWKSKCLYRYRPEGIFRIFFGLILDPPGTYAFTAKKGKFICTGHFFPRGMAFLEKRGGLVPVYVLIFDSMAISVRVPEGQGIFTLYKLPRKRAEYGFGEYGFKHRTQWVFRDSPSSGERTQWVPFSLLFVCKGELTEFFAEPTEFASKLSEFPSPKQYSRNSIPPVS